ncbi:MAG: T9SS type A sorting domain-containing protein [Ignavibacteria bacterium]|nr:T9SS type A sorting domain-containing protein [Ignavibacteria bacterium]
MNNFITSFGNLVLKGSKPALRISFILILLLFITGSFVWAQDNLPKRSILGPSVPTINAAPSVLNDFEYTYGYGPSDSRDFRVRGVNLSPPDDILTITGTDHYELSLDNFTFTGELNIQYTGGTLSNTNVYVRLRADLDPGEYKGEIIVISGGGAPPAEVACNGSVTEAIYWDGGANTTNWHDALNWNDNQVPANDVAVVLDNTLVSGSYTVDIGSANVSIKRLIISPESGNNITLTLTSANTSAPGLLVGDNVESTSDITVINEGVLVNNSGASSGTSIAFLQGSNGLLKLFNGGKYVHKTLSAHSNLVTSLSGVPATETGIFEFDVPMTSNYPVAINGATFGILSFRNSTAYDYTTSGVATGPEIRGILQFDNYGSGTGTFSSSDVFTFNMFGNLINNGEDLTFINQTFSFNGLNRNIISGTGGITFNDIILNNFGGLLLNRDITINGTLTLSNGVLNTGSNSIIFGTSASNPAENDMTYILGTTITGPRNIGTGSFNFLGIYIHSGPDNLSSVTTTRITGEPVIYPPNEGISCKWDISSTPQPVNGRLVDYSWWSVFDNGKNFSSTNLGLIWKSEDNGATWIAVDSVDVSINNPRVIQATDSTFSLWTVSSQNAPLPVALQSFTFNQVQRNVKLNWITGTELNNSGFNIERKTIDGIWAKIGFIQGKGNSNEPVSYSYEDKNLQTGKYKYRLKQIDYNGNFEYFELAGVVDVGIPAKYDLSQNYPNPFNPVTKINFDIPESGLVTMKVYDMLGREVSTLINEMKDAGYYTVIFDASGLASGVYFYRLNTNGFSSVKRLVVLK